jgi:hypothetical protein
VLAPVSVETVRGPSSGNPHNLGCDSSDKELGGATYAEAMPSEGRETQQGENFVDTSEERPLGKRAKHIIMGEWVAEKRGV